MRINADSPHVRTKTAPAPSMQECGAAVERFALDVPLIRQRKIVRKTPCMRLHKTNPTGPVGAQELDGRSGGNYAWPAAWACWSAWYELRTSGAQAALEKPIASASRSNIWNVCGSG